MGPSQCIAYPAEVLHGCVEADETKTTLRSERDRQDRKSTRSWVSVIDLFCDQVNTKPDGIALSCGADCMTYQELDLSSSDLAGQLIARGVTANDFVVILCKRDLDLVILLLAVLKTGACYVPIDIDTFSEGHIHETVAIVQPKLVLSTSEAQYDGHDTFFWTGRAKDEAIDGPHFHVPKIQPSDLAYMIFTSGTTARPKGVMIPHSAIANYVQQGDQNAPFNLSCTPNDVVMLLFSPAFDACTGVVFSTICNGGHLRVANPETIESDLGECTILPATPSILASITKPEAFPGIRAIFLGGESPTQSILAKWRNLSRTIWNCYGPTETTCTSLIAEILPEQGILLGRPMPGSTIVLLDLESKPSDEGEICISGPGLARGYYQNEDMTKEKFIEHENRRFYRTGDLARRSTEGLIFLGRRDALVKHRGFLINPESQVVPMLCAIPGVKSAIAFQHNDMLLAFTTPSDPGGTDIRSQLAGKCDSFLVPDRITAQETFPLTRNGKVDIRQLRQSLTDQAPYSEATDATVSFESSLLKQAIGKVLDTPVSLIPDNTSFWQLGGSSLSAIALLSELRSHGKTVPFGDLLGNRTIAQLESLLVPFKSDDEDPEQTDHESFPMTNLQQNLITGTIKNASMNYMLITVSFEHREHATVGSLLEQAWHKVLSRHSIFRTTFSPTDSTQCIKAGAFGLDWHECTVENGMYENMLQYQRKSLMDLSQSANPTDPPTALRLITIPNDRSVMLWLVHHARVDGWSAHMLMDELRSILDGEELPRAPQFSSTIKKSVTNDHRSRVIDTLKLKDQVPPSISSQTHSRLPFQRPGEPRSWCHSSTIIRPTSLKIADLETKAHAMGVSGGAVLYCAWSLLLMSYTGSSTSNFATLFSGRNRGTQGIERVVGLMLQFVPFSTAASSIDQKSQWLQSIQEDIEKFGNANSVEREQQPGTDNLSLPESLVVLQYGLPKLTECRQLPSTWSYSVSQMTEFVWTLLVEERDGHVLLRLVYDNLTVSSQVSERALEHLSNLIEAILRPENDSIQSLKQRMLSPSERSALTLHESLSDYNYHGPQTLKAAFETAADLYPCEIALETTQLSITYQELDRITNALAHELLPRCFRDETVAIFSDGSIDWIFSILAILKIGCTYCPIDMSFPPERIQSMLDICHAKTVLCPASHYPALYAMALPCDIVVLDPTLYDLSVIATRLPDRSGSHNTAILTFTSGTTGRPKAVRTRHVALLNYLSFPPARLHACPGVKMAQIFSCGFDACAAEIFGALCYGATLVLKEPSDPVANIQRSTSAIITPSFLGELDPADFTHLQSIMTGGEALSQALVDTWSPGRRMYNGYGPCECSIACLVSETSKGKPVTLGRNVPGMSVYVLDDELNPVPVGIPGQLYASGVQVSNGYASCDSADASKFIPDPFRRGYIMFRTGDMGRWTEKLEVEFLGRLDRHVKVRGYRVNLEEIETVLRQSSPEVNQAAVVFSEQTLTAYVSPNISNVHAIESSLAKLLPPYSRPSKIYASLQLPQTINQKIDYRALSSLTTRIDLTSSTATLPDDPLSIIVADVWRAALSKESPLEIGPFMESNFFALGGHSLLQLSVTRELSRRLGQQVSLRTVMLSSTLSELVDAIRSDHSWQPTVREPFLGYERDRKLDSGYASHHERQMLRCSRRLGNSAAFNCALLLTIVGDLDHDRLIRCLEVVLKKSRVLHSIFQFEDNNISRCVSDSAVPIVVREVTGAVDSLLDEETNKPFNLETEQLIRVTLFKAQDKTNHLLINAHHAIVDGTTMQMFCQLLQSLYQGGNDGDTLRTSALEDSTEDLDYLDWTRWTNLAPSPRFSKQGQFWPTYLRDTRPLFPTDENTTTSVESSVVTKCFPKDQTAAILQCCEDNGTSLQQFLTACAVLATNAVFGAEDVVAAIPYSNRTEPGTEGLMGCFLDSVNVRLALSEQNLSSGKQILSEVHTSADLAVSNYLPCDEVQDLIGADAPRFDVVVSVFPLVNCFSCDLSGCSTSIRPLKTKESKFPLMFEVFYNDDGITMHMEHQQRFVSNEQATLLESHFMRAINWLNTGMGVWKSCE